MRKIPTLFKRDPENMSRVTDEIHPDCGWVASGEGVATRKYNGWCCMVDGIGVFWKRAEVKRGKTPQPGFFLIERDGTTGKSVGWVRVGDGPEDRWFREGFDSIKAEVWDQVPCEPVEGTYELVGPKVQGNPENAISHILVRHASAEVLDCPTDPPAIKAFVAALPHEGVVWHHPDGRMAKLKVRDLR